jgi:hypothetical protein
MPKKHHLRLLLIRVWLVLAACVFIFLVHVIPAQAQKTVDGQTFTRYKAGHFRSEKPLNYNLFLAPLITVDPLGIGGKSTYALSAGSQITLWESKLDVKSLQGLRIKELYTALGYEFFPKQFDNLYASLGIRIKTFMPIVARMDGMYSFGDGRRGIATRFCFGFEIERFTVLLSGTIISGNSYEIFGDFHPTTYSPYSNAGGILLLIPIYNHKSQ